MTARISVPITEDGRQPYTEQERKDMAVRALHDAIHDPTFVSNRCGDMVVQKDNFRGIVLSTFAARAIWEKMNIVVANGTVMPRISEDF